jgi:hypothetical protein
MHRVTDFVAVEPERVGEDELCAWCRKERDGVGRIPCETLDDAMRAFGTHPETMARIRELLHGLPHDEIWLPQSRSSIALGLDGTAQAWVGKRYVQWRDGRFEPFPGYQSSDGSTAAGAGEERRGVVCPTCFLEMSVAGGCANCA